MFVLLYHPYLSIYTAYVFENLPSSLPSFYLLSLPSTLSYFSLFPLYSFSYKLSVLYFLLWSSSFLSLSYFFFSCSSSFLSCITPPSFSYTLLLFSKAFSSLFLLFLIPLLLSKPFASLCNISVQTKTFHPRGSSKRLRMCIKLIRIKVWTTHKT